MSCIAAAGSKMIFQDVNVNLCSKFVVLLDFQADFFLVVSCLLCDDIDVDSAFPPVCWWATNGRKVSPWREGQVLSRHNGCCASDVDAMSSHNFKYTRITRRKPRNTHIHARARTKINLFKREWNLMEREKNKVGEIFHESEHNGALLHHCSGCLDRWWSIFILFFHAPDFSCVRRSLHPAAYTTSVRRVTRLSSFRAISPSSNESFNVFKYLRTRYSAIQRNSSRWKEIIRVPITSQLQ